MQSHPQRSRSRECREEHAGGSLLHPRLRSGVFSAPKIPTPTVTCHHVIHRVFVEGAVGEFPLGRISGARFFFAAVSGRREKSVCYFLCTGGLVKFGGCVQIPSPRAGKYLSSRSSTSSSASSQPCLARSGSSVRFSSCCEY